MHIPEAFEYIIQIASIHIRQFFKKRRIFSPVLSSSDAQKRSFFSCSSPMRSFHTHTKKAAELQKTLIAEKQTQHSKRLFRLLKLFFASVMHGLFESLRDFAS